MPLYSVRDDKDFIVVEEIEAVSAFHARSIVSRRHGIPAWYLSANETFVDAANYGDSKMDVAEKMARTNYHRTGLAIGVFIPDPTNTAKGMCIAAFASRITAYEFRERIGVSDAYVSALEEVPL